MNHWLTKSFELMCMHMLDTYIDYLLLFFHSFDYWQKSCTKTWNSWRLPWKLYSSCWIWSLARMSYRRQWFVWSARNAVDWGKTTYTRGVAKGLLISKCPFGFIVWTKLPTKLFLDFCPEIFCTFLGASWKLFRASCRLPYLWYCLLSPPTKLKKLQGSPQEATKNFRAEIQK